jgi:GTPase Era involved in 16S rRNA processing
MKYHSHSFFDYGGARNAKGIIIGHKGTALKKVGVDSRADLEKFFCEQTY